MCIWLGKWWVFIVGFVTVCFIWLYFGGYDSAANGPDKFDSLNSLFAGLAFVGMFSALRMQSDELSLQRQELKATREQLELTRKAAEEQANVQMKALLLNTANVQLTELIKREESLYRQLGEYSPTGVHQKKSTATASVRRQSLEWQLEEVSKEISFHLQHIQELSAILRPLYDENAKLGRDPSQPTCFPPD